MTAGASQAPLQRDCFRCVACNALSDLDLRSKTLRIQSRTGMLHIRSMIHILVKEQRTVSVSSYMIISFWDRCLCFSEGAFYLKATNDECTEYKRMRHSTKTPCTSPSSMYVHSCRTLLLDEDVKIRRSDPSCKMPMNTI
jgi:hypothetical protein